MGLRCLFGHDFDDPEVEREREETDSEVVVTVREVKTCERCGYRQVVSENTEVTTVRTPEEVGLDESDEEAADDGPTHPTVDEEAVEEDFEPPTDPDEDDAEILDDGPERERGEWPEAADVEERKEEATPSTGADGAAVADDEPRPDPEAEGAEILDDEDDGDEPPRPDREPTRSETADDGAAWPEHEDEDEGFAAESVDGERTDVSFGGGLTPEPNATDDPSPYVGHEADDGDVEELVRAEDGPDPTSVGADTEYYCPNCGHASAANGSSMRPGDICPECHGGYIAERER